ncbi:thiamine diphosphokinase [Roseovarius faecimaris]|uniref:Thiamine diphosphokinase n=1 Tax=Roseovarius faecimaris TaxID=2494550 RepID=A0A6I6IWG0_9RHOB|nr:thiamine diphosphokinase [Roseovarius faecimaris]QGX97028.1 thiamine diphosphokinase [Roseovarius faecimaris]
MIVNTEETVTLIGGATFDQDMARRALALAPYVVAADGGADAALAHGLRPEAVIGDFDSISEASCAALPEASLHRIDEQDSTDFDKCLRNVSAPLVIGIGFSGDRLDHQLACYNTLVRHPAQRCLLLGREELVFLAPPGCLLPLEAGTTVSLFPMGAVEGVSDGLEWEIGGLNFAPDGRVGTSNRARGPVQLSVTAPKMLVILPEHTLEPVVEALRRTTAHWP